MTRLHRPVSEHLREDPVDEAAVDRVWAGVRRRVTARPQRARQVFTGLSLVAGVAAALLLLLRSSPAVGPVRLEDGSALALELRADDKEARRVPLSDGSQLQLDPGAFVEVLDNEATRFELRQARGAVTYEVHPGGPRRWMITCGPLTAEVVGTRFTLRRDPRGAEVAVDHGTVLVRGPQVPDSVKRLSDGMRLRVEEPVRTTPGDGSGSGAIDLEVMDVEALLAIADAARRGGHPAEASRALRSLAARFPRDERAALAAFTRGRIEADDLVHPAEAAEAFSLALRLGLPAALDEEAGARLVEARWSAHQAAAARSAVDDLARRHPEAADLARLRRLVGAP